MALSPNRPIAPSGLFWGAAFACVVILAVAGKSAFDAWLTGAPVAMLYPYALAMLPPFVLASTYTSQAKRLRNAEMIRAKVVTHYLDVPINSVRNEFQAPKATVVYEVWQGKEMRLDGFEMIQSAALKKYPVGTELDVLRIPFEGTVPIQNLWAVRLATPNRP